MRIKNKKYTIMTDRQTDKAACLFCGIKKSRMPVYAEDCRGSWTFFNIGIFCEKRGETVNRIL